MANGKEQKSKIGSQRSDFLMSKLREQGANSELPIADSLTSDV